MISRSKASKNRHILFGEGRELPNFCLPTHKQVGKAYLSEKNYETEPLRSVCKRLAEKLSQIWIKASVPTISLRGIELQLEKYIGDVQKVIRSKSATVKQDEIEKDLDTLFDICSCKCKELSSCCCPMVLKVPAIEHDFLTDQRTIRVGRIAGIDKKESARAERRLKRKSVSLSKEETAVKCARVVEASDNESDNETDNNSDTKTYSPSVSDVDTEVTSTRLKNRCLKNIALQADGFGISDRAVAAIVSATLVDFGIEHMGPVDRNKIRRERKLLRTSCKNADCRITGLYFDGRKDRTLKLEGDRQTVISEEHISILSEPNSKYVDHCTPTSGSAKSIADSIINTVDCTNLVCIGSDSTNVNTGLNNGVIRRMEIELGRPLHWSICLLHLNELPLRHLFHSLDGATTGPHSFNGPIGKSISMSVQKPIVSFAIIVGEPIICDKQLLSSDQLYFFEIVNAVKTGVVPDRFNSRTPGRLNHARWLTLANRVLRLYISTEDPSNVLILLAKFIVNSYAVVWFDIKKHSNCWNAAPHYYKMIETSRFLPVRYRIIVQQVLKRNSYPAHIESIILAMLKDNRQVIRKLALKKILRAREDDIPNRKFQVPEIRFQATSYEELIDWQTQPRLEPVLTKHIPTVQILAWLSSVEDIVIDIEPFPCHNQSVERVIKIVTESASKVYGHENRDGYIRVQLERRKLMPHFDTKSEFKNI
jgi:hypothetical protein